MVSPWKSMVSPSGLLSFERKTKNQRLLSCFGQVLESIHVGLVWGERTRGQRRATPATAVESLWIARALEPLVFERKIRRSNLEPPHIRGGTPWAQNGIPCIDVVLVRPSRITPKLWVDFITSPSTKLGTNSNYFGEKPAVKLWCYYQRVGTHRTKFPNARICETKGARFELH